MRVLLSEQQASAFRSGWNNFGKRPHSRRHRAVLSGRHRGQAVAPAHPVAAPAVRLFRNVYAAMYPPGLNEMEAEKPLASYRSLNAVFTRGVRPEYRPIPADTPELLCPCDGTVQDVGRVERGRILTVKGIQYLLASLLPDIDISPYEGGHFAIIFLSPIDCHRVFSPQDGWLEEIVHVPGARLLVHPPFQRAEFPVYTLNERVIFRLSTDVGSCLVVMVAGWGVGNITLPFAANSQLKAKHARATRLELPRSVRRGDWIATFELGSSVVLITSSSLCTTPLVSPNAKVHYGQPILKFASNDSLLTAATGGPR